MEAHISLRQKLKVTELKELLHKHDLPQTGKKDDLVKRALENNIAPEAEEEELVSTISLGIPCVKLTQVGRSRYQRDYERDRPGGQ